MGSCHLFSPTPSICSDAPAPEPLQEKESINLQVPQGFTTRRLSRTYAFSEADQPVAEGPKLGDKNSFTRRWVETQTMVQSQTPVEALIPAETQTPIDDDDKSGWLFYVGNIHPRTTSVELYELLFKDLPVRDITIRNSRGCGAIFIPHEVVTENDRCYASVELKGFEAAQRVWSGYDPKKPPILHGLPLVIGLSVADMPEVPDFLKQMLEELESTEKPSTRKRITAQKTEVFEDQRRSLAGPSRTPKRKPKPKPRY